MAKQAARKRQCTCCFWYPPKQSALPFRAKKQIALLYNAWTSEFNIDQGVEGDRRVMGFGYKQTPKPTHVKKNVLVPRR